MKNVSHKAAYLREALWLGLISVVDVVSWSDSIIAECSQPDYAFVELSCMSGASPLDVLNALESLSGDISTIDILPTVLGLAHQRLVQNPGYAMELARCLYGIYVKCNYQVTDELREIGWFDDAFGLAADGSYGSVEQIQEELIEFTAQFVGRGDGLPVLSQ